MHGGTQTARLAKETDSTMGHCIFPTAAEPVPVPAAAAAWVFIHHPSGMVTRHGHTSKHAAVLTAARGTQCCTPQVIKVV